MSFYECTVHECVIHRSRVLLLFVLQASVILAKMTLELDFSQRCEPYSLTTKRATILEEQDEEEDRSDKIIFID